MRGSTVLVIQIHIYYWFFLMSGYSCMYNMTKLTSLLNKPCFHNLKFWNKNMHILIEIFCKLMKDYEDSVHLQNTCREIEMRNQVPLSYALNPLTNTWFHKAMVIEYIYAVNNRTLQLKWEV